MPRSFDQLAAADAVSRNLRGKTSTAAARVPARRQGDQDQGGGSGEKQVPGRGDTMRRRPRIVVHEVGQDRGAAGERSASAATKQREDIRRSSRA